MYSKTKDKFKLFFAAISLIGIILTKQNDAPFTNIYGWLYSYFPGFNAFREASKFYFLLSIGYSFLIGYLVQYIRNKKINKKHIFAPIIFIVIFLTFFANSKSLIDKSINTLFVPRHMPSDYEIFNNYIKANKGMYRILWVPVNSKWGIYTNSNPAVTGLYLNSKLNLFEKKDIFTDFYKPANAIVEFLEQSFSDELLDQTNIRYVVLPIEDTKNDDNFFDDYGKNRAFYVGILEQKPYLKKLDIHTQELLVFENTDFHPKIYITKEPESMIKQVSSDVQFEMISSTEYKINLKNLQAPVYLNFSEEYSNEWVLAQKSDSKYLELNGILHAPTIFNYNSFYIDPIQIIDSNKSLAMKINDDSIDLEVYLIYKPQIVYKKGLQVAGLTALSLVAIYLFTVVRKKNG